MASLQPTTERLVAELVSLCQVHGPGRTAVRRPRLDLLADMFADLGRREPEALPWVVHGLGHAEPRVVAAAAAAAGRLAESWPVDRWPRLDSQLRRQWGGVRPWPDPWPGRAAEAMMVERLPASGTARTAGLVIMACHGNGFVRQRAVAALAAGAPTAPALAVVGLRLDDWVQPVRSAAVVAWRALTAADRETRVAEVLPLVRRLAGRRRVDAQALRDALEVPLSTAAGGAALVRLLGGPGRSAARAAAWLVEQLDRRPAGWLDAALGSRHGSIRLPACRWLAKHGTAGQLAKRLDAMARDPFPPVRHLALDACRRRLPAQLEHFVRRGLVDRLGSIRRRCQDLLVLDLDVDPVPIYRRHLAAAASPIERAATLLGLAETGGEDDRQAVAGFIADPAPRVRAAALTALARLPGSVDAAFLRRHLADASPRVVRTAASLHAAVPWAAADLVAAFRRTDLAAGRQVLVRQAGRLSAWDRLLFLLDALEDPDGRVRAGASAGLQRALEGARGWAAGPPTAEQRRQLHARLRFRAPSLGTRLGRRLRFLLRLTEG